MACSKYIISNTGSTTMNFSYQRCDDFMWEYQVELVPNQTKNLWVNNGSLIIPESYLSSISLLNEGVFPPTPTPSSTSSITPTPTPTPSVTPTNTPSGV